MISFKKFIKESEVPVNSMASGSIATFDPLLLKKKKIMRRTNVAPKLPS